MQIVHYLVQEIHYLVQEIHSPGAGDSPGGVQGAAPRISHSFEPVNEPVNEPIKHTGASAIASAPARSAKQDYSPEFETAWQAYPKRAGGNSKAAAFKARNARLKDGVKPEAMLAGVKRYAAYARATGSAGTQYVKQAASFFGPDRHFEESGRRHPLPAVGTTALLPACLDWGVCPTILANLVRT